MTSASSRSDDPAAQPDWTAIRQAYVGRASPVRDICRAHGINTQTLYRQAAPGSLAAPPRAQDHCRGAQDACRLLARLRRLAAGQIDAIEARRAAGSSPGIRSAMPAP
jgi:transposase-like protein